MKNELKIILSIGVLLITFSFVIGCFKSEPCDGPFPDRIYKPGEKIIFIPTREEARVVSKHYLFSSDKCEKRKFGDYSIIFVDKTEVCTNWKDMKLIDQ